ncbi:MAG TPA: DUF2805 domain-containing protein [Flavobacterium sp.]|nr:DUF2805 domain-containing protein [Flavobacterium sp.]
MKKSKISELDNTTLEKIVLVAQSEKKPYEVIKEKFGVVESELNDFMQKMLSKEVFDLWKKKAVASKPKPKPMKFNVIEDDDLDAKYYIKNKFD